MLLATLFHVVLLLAPEEEPDELLALQTVIRTALDKISPSVDSSKPVE